MKMTDATARSSTELHHLATYEIAIQNNFFSFPSQNNWGVPHSRLTRQTLVSRNVSLKTALMLIVIIGEADGITSSSSSLYWEEQQHHHGWYHTCIHEYGRLLWWQAASSSTSSSKSLSYRVFLRWGLRITIYYLLFAHKCLLVKLQWGRGDDSRRGRGCAIIYNCMG